MEHLLNAAQLILLLVLTVMQLGRWSQKTEDGPTDALRIAKDALAKALSVSNDLRRHKHNYQDYINSRPAQLDATYARKREVELELETVNAKVEINCERVEAIEGKIERFSGV